LKMSVGMMGSFDTGSHCPGKLYGDANLMALSRRPGYKLPSFHGLVFGQDPFEPCLSFSRLVCEQM
jgi:hypothetical protein